MPAGLSVGRACLGMHAANRAGDTLLPHELGSFTVELIQAINQLLQPCQRPD